MTVPAIPVSATPDANGDAGKPSIRWSLTSRLIFHILLWGILYSLLSSTLQTWHWYTAQKESVAQGLEQTGENYAPSLAAMLFKLDEESMRIALRSIMNQKHVVYAGVIEKDSAVRYSVEVGDPSARQDIVRTFPLRRPRAKEELGTLTLAVSLKEVRANIMPMALSNLASGALGYALVALLIALIHQVILVNRLKRLVSTADNLSLEELEKPLSALPLQPPAQGKNGKWDELDELTQALNGLRMRVSQAITARDLSQRFLQESEERFRQLVENMKEIFWVRDVESEAILYISPLFERIWGVPVELLYKDPWAHIQMVHPQDREKVLQKYKDLVSTGEPVEYEYRITREGGELIWLRSRFFPLVDESGKVYRVVGISEDITEEHRAEEERKSHVRLLEDLEGVDRAIRRASNLEKMLADVVDLVLIRFSCDRAWLLTPCDPDAAAYHVPIERTRPEFPGAGVLRQTVPAKPGRSKTMATALRSDGPVTSGPGNQIPISESFEQYQVQSSMIMAVFPRTGSPWLFGVHQCSSPRVWTREEQTLFKGIGRRIEDALTSMLFLKGLRESEENYRELVENAASIILRMDHEGRVIFFNEYAQSFFGFSRDEVIGKSVLETIVPKQESTGRDLSEMIRNIIDDPKGYAKNVNENIRKNDERVWVNWSNKAVPGKLSDYMEVLCVGTDITDRVLGEKALVKAKEESEAANRAKTAFLANMSHELRTPLSGMMGALQLLLRSVMEQGQATLVEKALNSGRNLTRLLSDLLDLSRVEAGKMSLVSDEFELTACLRHIIETFQPQAEDKGLVLSMDIAPETPPYLNGDLIRLRQILFNLVGNAVKFTQTGQIHLEASMVSQNTDPDHVRILFSVSDTGIGIPKNMLDYVFEPFAQLEQDFTRQFQGAGLGLQIVKRLTELLGGEVFIESEQDEGTTISCALPFGIGTKQPPAEEKDASPRLNVRRVLLVEDEPVNRMAVQLLLQREGLDVTCAESGKKGLEFLKKDRFDLVLMDIQMPEMNGMEATRRLRDESEFGEAASTPVLALTAYAMEEEKNAILEAGLDAVITKPFQFEELMAALRSLPARS